MPSIEINFQRLKRFVLVGGSTGVLYFGLTYGLVERFAIDTTIASTFALLLAVCYNYVLHYHWTFSPKAPHGIVLLKYLAMCVGAILLNAIVMELGVSNASLHYLLAQIIATVMVILWTLSISSIWVFR